MLPLQNRLLKKKEFEKVKTEGQVLTSRFFGIAFVKNNLGVPRFGFIVSNKISKKAVLRNKTKRLLREVARGLLPRVKDGVDVLFLAKKTILEASFKDVSKEAEKLFKKGQLFK